MFKGCLYRKKLDDEALKERSSDNQTLPKQACIFKKPLTFGDQKGFEVTTEAKVQEAHIHKGTGQQMSGENLTVIFHGVASFTFRLQKATRVSYLRR